MKNVEDLLKSSRIIALDTSLFIYFFQEHPDYLAVCATIFREIEFGHNIGVISTVTLAELLVKPFQDNQPGVADEIFERVRFFPHLRLQPTDATIARTSAQLRAHYGLELPDAIQVATGITEGAKVFFTNDKKLSEIQEIPVYLLSQLRTRS